ncbi:hypothetical protein A9Q84_08205 [Halobacteriovorax marinus]|uniref:Lipoprotein n=1 Tax=Halobacteriovorax marinus TaxID=97084 RepID=A0A1Y5F604_9BACT|nr:hypothetical protein A9Q84_08205 [Halobacteriovorax marinus]
MKQIILLFSLFLTSCAGYQYKYQDNPFSSYDVNSVSIPAFLNKSLVPNISAKFTSSISSVISQDTTLKIYSGDSDQADATLVGIISSSTKRNEFLRTVKTTLIDETYSSSIGNRREFYLPSQTSFKVNLYLILIKKPTSSDLKLIQKDFLPFLNQHPKVVFTKSIDLTASFSRVLNANSGPDDGGVVNATKNREILNKSVETMANSAATVFRETVLNAF